MDFRQPAANALTVLSRFISRIAVLVVLASLPVLAQAPDLPAVPDPSGHLLYVDRQTGSKIGAGWKKVVASRPEFSGAAFISPQAKGWTGLALKALDSLPPEQASRAAKELSAVLHSGVVHLALTPDERAWYFYWDQGRLVDRYCSNPGKPGEVEVEVVRSWQGRPELLLPVCRGVPLSKTRTEVSITDFNGFLYSYYPEMKTTRPASWRTAADLMVLLTQVLGVGQSPAPFASLSSLPGWTRL